MIKELQHTSDFYAGDRERVIGWDWRWERSGAASRRLACMGAKAPRPKLPAASLTETA